MKRKTKSTKLTQEVRNAERMMEAARLKRCGLSLQEIGAKLGCSRQRAQVIVQEGIDAYRQEAKQAIADWLEGALARLMQAEDEAWIEWQRSKQDRQRRTVKTLPARAASKSGQAGAKKVKPKTIETTDMIEGQCGDAAYLAEIRGSIEACAKLLGIVKSGTDQRVQVDVHNQQTATVQQCTPAELMAKYAAQIQASYEAHPAIS